MADTRVTQTLDTQIAASFEDLSHAVRASIADHALDGYTLASLAYAPDDRSARWTAMLVFRKKERG
jgi:hypothetical protein